MAGASKESIRALVEYVAASLVDDPKSVKVVPAAKENYGKK